MKHYAAKRLLQLIPLLLAITFLSYGMMRIAGSDVVEQKMENTGETVSQEIIDAAREELGLDKPFVVQYFTWLGNLLQGDMGTSYVSNKPVFSTFVSKLPATLLLTFVSIIGNLAQVNEVGADGHVIDLVRVPDLHLHALAEWGEQVCKDHLLIPQWLVAAFLH